MRYDGVMNALMPDGMPELLMLMPMLMCELLLLMNESWIVDAAQGGSRQNAGQACRDRSLNGRRASGVSGREPVRLCRFVRRGVRRVGVSACPCCTAGGPMGLVEAER